MLNSEIFIAREAARDFRNAEPFPHLVLDNAFEHELLSAAVFSWPNRREKCWRSYQRGKRGAMRPDDLSPELANVMRYGLSRDFIAFLECLTGIDELIADPTFSGGGLHEVETGGSLGMHVDLNRLGELYRRVNVMLYVNDDWRPEWGGDLELRSEPKDPVGAVKIAPLWNRMVIFEATDRAWHGHPQPLICPSDRFRRSFAWYYYTREQPADYREKHSTVYVR